MSPTYSTLHDLYLATLKEVYSGYDYLNSPRGQDEREKLGFSARLAHPYRRYCFLPERRQNIVFNYAEVLWYLSGKNDLAFIEYYAPSMRRYSPDGHSLPGTGYGARLSKKLDSGQTPVERLLTLLSADDAASKRAVLQIFDDSEDLYSTNTDVSCTLALQCLLRDGKLHMISFMRANDAYVGLLNDIFSFTFLQELLAVLLDVEVGTYGHHVGSIHIYTKDLLHVERLLSADQSDTTNIHYPRIPGHTTLDDINAVLDWESSIRADTVSLTNIREQDFDPFWAEILTLFWIYRQITFSRTVERSIANDLHPVHRQLVLNRWPDAFK